MIKKLRVLKNLDLFGVPYKTKITLNEDEQKTLIGGMVTAILYSVSLAYFIYIVYQWRSGQLLPGTSSMSTPQSFSNYQFNRGELIEFSYWRYSNQLLDPFDPQNIILLPLGYKVTNGVQGEAFNLISISNSRSRYNSLLISPDGFQIQQNVNSSLTPDEKPEIQLSIILRKCDESYLTEGQKCGSQEQVQQFWSSGVNYISFWFKLRQFNTMTKEIDIIEKQIYFPLNNFSNTNGQFLFKPVNLKIDDGILFSNEQAMNFLNDVEIITGQTGMDFQQNLLQYSTYISFFMRVDPIIHYNRVTYPKLAQILADVGSITSTLLMIRVVIILINQHILEERIIHRIVRIYHPFLKLNQQEPQELIKKFKQQAKRKLIITDIINDVYNLKKFIESRYGKKALKNISKSKLIESDNSNYIRITPQKTYRQKSWG